MFEPETDVADLPLISRSAASTPSTGSLNWTAICVSELTVPGAGVRMAIVGAIDGVTNTRITAEVAKAPKLSMATPVKLYVPTPTPPQMKLYGETVSSPILAPFA